MTEELFVITYKSSTTESLVLLHDNPYDPLDWSLPVVVFENEDAAISFSEKAYTALIDIILDWKSVSLEIVNLADIPEADRPADFVLTSI